jgi:hypothetical protein
MVFRIMSKIPFARDIPTRLIGFGPRRVPLMDAERRCLGRARFRIASPSLPPRK